jgi:hypothetical protein
MTNRPNQMRHANFSLSIVRKKERGKKKGKKEKQHTNLK